MTCFYNPKWRNYRTPTKKDILVFWHQITLFPLSHVWALTRGCPCWTYKRVQEKFRQDGWWIYNRMDYPWRFQHLQPKGTQQSWGQVWVTVLNQHSISLPSTVTHMLPICSFGKWKWEKPEDDATISHQLHSPLWSPLRVPVIAGQSDRHRRTRRSRPAPLLRPAATALRSGEDALLREEELWYRQDDDRRVGMVVQLREREKREEGVLTHHVSIPSCNDPPSLPGNGSNSGSGAAGGGEAQNKRDNTL